ncbi:MAG: DUF4837 family protein [Bacillota bacterium]
MKSRLLLFAALIPVLLLTSCSHRNQPSASDDDRIYVVADTAEFHQIESSLDSAFSRIIYTPQPETTFYLIRKDISELESIKSANNIILAAPLNSGSQTSGYIASMLDESQRQSAAEDKQFAFNRYNLWSQNQLVMILTSRDIISLKNNLKRDGLQLYSRFQKLYSKRLYDNLYNPEFEDRDIERKFLKEYGWMIFVPKDFELVLDKPQDKFIWLRSMPENDLAKWVFIHWIENASPAFLNPDSIAKERDQLTRKYLKPAGAQNFVKITEEYNTIAEMNFHKHYAISTQGLWEMSDKTMGGPFINYTLYDEKSRRIYMLDGSLYAPRYLKKGLIQQLDVILQSFLTEDQVSPERKRDLGIKK